MGTGWEASHTRGRGRLAGSPRKGTEGERRARHPSRRAPRIVAHRTARIVRRASYGAPAPTGEADGEEFGDADGEEHRRRREGVLS